MRRFLSSVFVFLLIFAVVSCGGKKDEKDYEERVSKKISAAEGGKIETSDGKISIEIPAEALESDTTITMTVYDASGVTGENGEKAVSKLVDFEPDGIIFKKPVLITMTSTENVENKVISAAVYHEDGEKWSYSDSGAAVKVSRGAAGDPIMTSASGDPIMLNASGDPIMMSASGDPIMMSASGDPIMATASGDPIMNAASGDPIMMTTGHFTAYTFIAVEPKEAVEPGDTEPVDDGDTTPAETDDDEPVKPDGEEIGDIDAADNDEVADEDEDIDAVDNDEVVDENEDIDDDDDVEVADENEDTDTDIDIPEPDEDVVPEPVPVYSKVICTGQTHCSDGESIIDCPKEGEEFYGQDAQYIGRKSCVPHKYKKVEPGEEEVEYDQIIDENTGLRWLWLNEDDVRNEDIETRCESLEYGGIENWRRPTPKEFFTIADHGRGYPAIREFYFKGADGYYWTSVEAVTLENGNGRFWTFNASSGGISNLSKSSYGGSLVCVSGDEYGKINPENYTDNSDGTVFDSSTNLLWQKTTAGGKTWKEALAYCENLEYAGYSDWRLPNMNELVTLLDYSQTAAPVSQFPEMPSDTFWTSTYENYYGGAEGAFYVSFGTGAVAHNGASAQYSVRCVRTSVDPYSETIPLCDETRVAPCEDPSTHYVWSKPDVNSSSPRNKALSWKNKAVECRESRDGGIMKWRVPTIDEIRTLLGSSDKLKTNGECKVTVACINYDTCFEAEKCSEGEGFESSLYDYGYIVSGTLTGDADGEDSYGDPVYLSWAVNLKTGSIVSFNSSSSNTNSYSRCIKDDSIPDPVELPYEDSISGLAWSDRSISTFSWYGAATYCQNLVYGGSNNWRVPTMQEIKTLVKNCTRDDGCASDMTGKYSVLGEISTLWTSTVDTDEYEATPALHTFNFMTASENHNITSYYINTEKEKVRCVRTLSEPANVTGLSFPFNDGDLLWSKVSDKEYYNSDAAAEYCAGLNSENYGGKTTWRLPTFAELARLLNREVCSNKDSFLNYANNTPPTDRCSDYTFGGYSILGDMFMLKSSTNSYNLNFASGIRSNGNGKVRCVVSF